jgi:S-adenosyl-L-methionine hydrolase (adenosine-forming)
VSGRPFVTLLTDYGPGTEHVGALHAVIAARAPGAERVDLAHDVPPGDVRWGAILLARLAPLAPPGVHLAVVDPGVGSERRGLAAALRDGRHLVGPDNGLLGPAAAALGAEAAVELTAPEHRLEPVSATFHGRDVFAPAAAHLAGGGALGDLGPAVPPDSIRHPPMPEPRAGEAGIEAMAVGADRFGNVALLAGARELTAARMQPEDRVWVLVAGRRSRAVVGRTFADVPRGGLLVYVDSHGMLSLAVGGGNALKRLGVEPGEVVGVVAA